jgi:hypothetical protein
MCEIQFEKTLASANRLNILSMSDNGYASFIVSNGSTILSNDVKLVELFHLLFVLGCRIKVSVHADVSTSSQTTPEIVS